MQGSGHVNEYATVFRFSSILPSEASKDAKVVYVVPVGADVVELKPLMVRPMTELLKTPLTLSVLLDMDEQFPTKLRKLVQLRVPIVK